MGQLLQLLRSMHAANRFMRLSERERWLIVEAGFYLLCAKIATLTTSPRTLLAMGSVPDATRVQASAAQPLSLPLEVAEAVSAIEKSSVRLQFSNCLIRAVALRMLLARQEYATELHIGARKDESGHFAAHAWLTYNEIVLMGGTDAKALYRELIGSSHALLQ